MKSKKGLFLTLLAFSLLSCSEKNSSKKGNTSSQDGTTIMRVDESFFIGDTISLENFDMSDASVYPVIEGAILLENSNRLKILQNKFYLDRGEKFAVFYEKKRKALVQVRGHNFEVYLKWLDAEKMGDYSLMMKVEDLPEFSDYRVIKGESQAEFDLAEKLLKEQLANEVAKSENRSQKKLEKARSMYKN